MWKAHKIKGDELEEVLNRLERNGWEIVSTLPVSGYSKHDMVVVAKKDHRMATEMPNGSYMYQMECRYCLRSINVKTGLEDSLCDKCAERHK